MGKDKLLIANKKAMLRAAQSVWAANKYFVLACSQDDYNEIRRLLKSSNKEIITVYKLLKAVDTLFQTVPSGELPQIQNALYHIAGYFKKIVSKEKRDEIIYLIESNPMGAIRELEYLTKKHHVEYLLYARIWTTLREKPFNIVPIKLKTDGKVYNANELVWLEDHLTVNSSYLK